MARQEEFCFQKTEKRIKPHAETILKVLGSTLFTRRRKTDVQQIQMVYLF